MIIGLPNKIRLQVTMEWMFIMLLLCSCKLASSLSFTATPDRVVIGDSGNLTLACSVTESDVSRLHGLEISRARTPGSIAKEPLASFVFRRATLSEGITNDKGFSATGDNIDASSRLELSMDKTKLTCSDARLYKCLIVYESSSTGSILVVESNLTLQVFVLPQMLPPLQAKRNGNFIEGGTQSDRARFEVGDLLELQCRANIGSIDSVTLRWRKTSEMDSSQFIGYQPEEGSYDDGSPLSDNQCGYTRTATIRHNVSTPVTGYDLAFECYVSVSGYPSSALTPSGVYTTTNNLRYYVEVLRETSQSTTDVVTSCSCSTNIASFVGVAIGSVAATLIVIGVVHVVTKCLRMQNGKRKERKAELSVSQDAVDTYNVYINENQYPATNIGHAAPAEYEVLQESAREPNTYSDLHIEQ